jgi:hypothetical protein
MLAKKLPGDEARLLNIKEGLEWHKSVTYLKTTRMLIC